MNGIDRLDRSLVHLLCNLSVSATPHFWNCPTTVVVLFSVNYPKFIASINYKGRTSAVQSVQATCNDYEQHDEVCGGARGFSGAGSSLIDSPTDVLCEGATCTTAQDQTTCCKAVWDFVSSVFAACANRSDCDMWILQVRSFRCNCFGSMRVSSSSVVAIH